MNSPISFTIPGKPVPWGRARIGGGRAGKPKLFNPMKPEVWKKQAQPFINAAFAGKEPCRGPTAVHVDFHFKHPKSWPRERKERTLYVTNKNLGDLDRLLNLLYDALGGVAYHDDSQVAIGSQGKYYTFDEERLEVRVSPIEDGGGEVL